MTFPTACEGRIGWGLPLLYMIHFKLLLITPLELDILHRLIYLPYLLLFCIYNIEIWPIITPDSSMDNSLLSLPVVYELLACRVPGIVFQEFLNPQCPLWWLIYFQWPHSMALILGGLYRLVIINDFKIDLRMPISLPLFEWGLLTQCWTCPFTGSDAADCFLRRFPFSHTSIFSCSTPWLEFRSITRLRFDAFFYLPCFGLLLSFFMRIIVLWLHYQTPLIRICTTCWNSTVQTLFPCLDPQPFYSTSGDAVNYLTWNSIRIGCHIYVSLIFFIYYNNYILNCRTISDHGLYSPGTCFSTSRPWNLALYS